MVEVPGKSGERRQLSGRMGVQRVGMLAVEFFPKEIAHMARAYRCCSVRWGAEFGGLAVKGPRGNNPRYIARTMSGARASSILCQLSLQLTISASSGARSWDWLSLFA